MIQVPLAAPQAEAPAASAVPGSVTTDAALNQAQQVVEAAQVEARETHELNQKAATLRAGQFLWHPERAQGGRVEMVVSLAQQKAYVYRAGKLIAVTTVSTGRAGHRTPTGTFPIIEKHRTHFSNLYNNAPMPNMQRLTMGGIALHAGQLPGYAASHGCVRLPMEFSRLLFGVTARGDRVHIIAGAPPAASEALAFATGRSTSGMQTASAR
jgi:lipoprotein-anchoring transpeptidase ErfK/SrfK